MRLTQAEGGRMWPNAVRNLPFGTEPNQTKEPWAVRAMATLLGHIQPELRCRKT
jgi:hypothetical protein